MERGKPDNRKKYNEMIADERKTKLGKSNKKKVWNKRNLMRYRKYLENVPTRERDNKIKKKFRERVKE